MKLCKKCISALLVVLMMMSILPAECMKIDANAATALSCQQVTSIVENYLSIVGTSRYWNAGYSTDSLKSQVNAGDYLSCTTRSACSASPSHSSSTGGCTSNVFTGVGRGLSQCWGFGDYMEYVIFKTTSATGWEKKYSVDSNFKFKPGDFIWSQKNSSSQHIMIVYKVEGNRVFIIECNYGGRCKINTRELTDPHSYVNYSSSSYVMVPPSSLRSDEQVNSCTGYNIAVNTDTAYASTPISITVTPFVNDRNAYDSEITGITLYLKKPDGSVGTINCGTNKTTEFYFGSFPTGVYVFYARVDTKYGSFTGAENNGAIQITLHSTPLTAIYFTTDEVMYRRIKFTDLDTYLTESSDANVVSSKYSSGNSQIWKLIRNDDYSYTIVSLATGKALDIEKGKYVEGTNVIAYDLQYSDNQKWDFCRNGDEKYYLRALNSNSAVLDVNGGTSADNTNVQIWTFNGGDAQKIELVYPYMITYNANGGSGAPSTQYKDYNKSISLSSTKPTRSGYTFLGWATSSSATSANYSAGANYSSNADLTLYAVWKKNTTYTLSYNANGGSGAPTSQTGATSYTISSTVPTRFGYTFLGWAKSNSATAATYKTGDSITLTANTTLYAVWKSASTISTGTAYNTDIDFAGQARYYTFTPSSSGDYIFESTGSLDAKISICNTSGTELDSDDDGGSDRNFSLTINLTAGTKYYVKVYAYSTKTGSTSFTVKKDTPVTYTLTYNANGGSGAPLSQTGATSYTISATVPTRFGYTFHGWSKNSSATAWTYEIGDDINLTSNTTLYAVWSSARAMNIGTSYVEDISFANQECYYSFTPSSTGTYVFESSGSLDTKVVVYNSSGTELGNDDDGGTDGNFKLSTNLTAGTKYYIKVRAYGDKTGETTLNVRQLTYSLKYNANGGSGAPATQTGATSYTISSTIPTRFGYTFLGWSKSSSATSATYTAGNSITLTEATTLYAVWENNMSSMSVNSSNSAQISTGGEMKHFTFTPTTSGTYVIYSTGSDDTKVYLYNTSGTELDSDDDDGDSNNFRLEYNLTAGTKYTFGVRYYNSTKTGTISFKFGKVFTITYNANGGSEAPSAQKKDYGKNLTLSSSTPTRSGYVFKGWATSSSATSATYLPGSTYSTEADVTLYAVWHSHSYSSTVSKSATCTTTGTRTYTCNGCSDSYTETIPATGHKWTAATCTAAKTCSVCKATDGAALGHSYTSKVTKAATCTAAGVKTFTCSKCSNSYTESIPATGHTWTAATCTAAKTCSVCKATDGTALGHNYTSKVTKAATCTAAGVKTFTCSKCSNSYTETIPATGHTWTAATCTAAKTCSVCKATDGAALGHSYTSKVTKAATCTTAGVKTFTCSKCNHSYTESIPATGHNWTAATCTAAKTCSVCKATDGSALGHSYTSKVTKAATCTVAGVKTFTCSKCSNSYTESIPATGHNWTAATCTAARTCSVCKATDGTALGHSYTSKVTKAATCTAAGVKTFTCSKCSHSYTESIPATGHTWTAATCTAAKTCSVCKTTDGAALGHNYTSTVTKAATCTVAGVKTFTCSKCSNSYTESIPATGHTPGAAATCTTNQTCTVCDAILNAKLGHTVGNAVMENKTEATCTEAGSYDMVVYCATCGEKLSTTPYTITAPGHTPGAVATCTEDQTCTVCGEVLAAKLGHDYDSVVTAPTCMQNGYTIHTCSVCGDSYVDKEVAALGHNWDEGVVTLEPTATQNGIRTYTCAVCGETKTEEIEKLPAVGFEGNAEQAVVDKNGDIVAVLNLTAAQLLEQAGESAVLVNNKGESLTDADKVGTGAVLTLADGTQYKIVVLGDVDGDGAISAGDARAALRHSVGLDTLDGAYLQAADVEEKGVTAGSARSILRASVGLDNPDEWFNKVVG